MPRKSTTDAMFALRVLMEKYREGQKELWYCMRKLCYCVFVDLEKAYDKVPREELVVLYEEVTSSGEVCQGCARYV